MTKQQEAPGIEREIQPQADHGEQSYHGSGKLEGKAAIITGGDTGEVLAPTGSETSR